MKKVAFIITLFGGIPAIFRFIYDNGGSLMAFFSWMAGHLPRDIGTIHWIVSALAGFGGLSMYLFLEIRDRRRQKAKKRYEDDSRFMQTAVRNARQLQDLMDGLNEVRSKLDLSPIDIFRAPR